MELRENSSFSLFHSWHRFTTYRVSRWHPDPFAALFSDRNHRMLVYRSG
jgi:hypothetical protein